MTTTRGLTRPLTGGVARALDKTGGSSRGPDIIVDGAFANGLASWPTFVGGTGAATASGGGGRSVGTDIVTNFAFITQTLALLSGRRYEIKGTATVASGTAAVLAGATPNASQDLAQAVSGAFTVQFTAGAASRVITLRHGSAGGDVTFDNISVRLIL